MGDDKLKIDDKNANDLPPDSTKPNSTDVQDIEKAGKSQEKMSKANGSEMDGADEKMLSKEEKPTGEESKIAVAGSEYSLNADKQNGEAKLDIGDLKPAFVGMGKDELMKFANDPFWVRLRWILFISFWLIWLAMLIGAIVIIITAPKCYPPAPRTWYESGPLEKVGFSDFDKIDNCKERLVKGLIVSHPDEDSYTPVNSSEILPFLKSAKEKSVNIIVSLNPVHSDEFFFKSEHKLDGLDDYYVWADAKGKTNSIAIPPNNWLSPFNESAWKFSNKRQQFYYSPFKKPTLNFRNPEVVNKFTEIINDWVAAGINGFHLIGIPFMLVDEELKNETIAMNVHGFIHDQYEFYNHGHTVNVEGIAEILKQWRHAAKKIPYGGPFMLDEDLLSLDPYKINDTLLIDLPKHSIVFEKKGHVSTAKDIYNGVTAAQIIFEDPLSRWPIWQYEVTSLPSTVMNILTMLLPGSIYMNEGMMMEEVDAEYFELLKIRECSSITHGIFHHQVLNNTDGNTTVYAYQRVQTGNPGYLVAVNPNDNRLNVDLTEMANLSDEVTIQLLSTNYTVNDYRSSVKIPANNLEMPPKSAAVLTYVPKS